MAEQYLSDFSKPTINSNIARRILANEILRGVAQDVLETDGQGITQRFSNDVSGAQIRITQFMPFNQEARELGATLYGENFDGRTAIQANTNGLGVDVITVINQNIDIPQVTTDMLPIDFLGNVMKNLKMDINNNLNAMTIAGKFVATANAVTAGTTEFKYITKASATGDDWRYALMGMNAELDNGDVDNGLAYFPDEDRCFVLQVSIIPYLLNKGIFTLGGANHAYEMLAMGGISPGEKQDIRKGYVGDFMGHPVYKANTLIWKLAAKYAGVPVWALYDVYGYISSGYANVRAIAQEDQIKVIDSPDGPGVRVQPNFRMGFKSLYAKGNVFLCETGYTNPADSGTLTLTGPASRTAYSSDTTLSALTVGGVTASWVTAETQWTVSVTTTATQGAIEGTVTDTGNARIISGTGTITYTTGTTTAYVVVEAEDGTKGSNKVVITYATSA